jgi:hypothetical protein
MNNRLDSIFKKIRFTNKSLYVLEMFGFETIQSNTTNQNLIEEDLKNKTYQTDTKTNQNVEIEISDMTDRLIYTNDDSEKISNKGGNFIAEYNTSDITTEFKPTNITEQFKAIWINLEQRRKWLYPTFFIIFTSFLSFYVVDSYLSNQKIDQTLTEEFILLSSSLNTLYFTLDEIVDIATDPFFSRYDISNSSADLQSIESKLIQYQNTFKEVSYDFEKIRNYGGINELENNLINHFYLIDQLDLLLSYRIITTEILIYPNLPFSADKAGINKLTIDLSNVSANSISNYEQLPVLSQFNNHNETLFQSINIANELHGQYLASLRNKETDTTQSLLLSIELNREFVKNSYQKSLTVFRTDMDFLYDSLIPFP